LSMPFSKLHGDIVPDPTANFPFFRPICWRRLQPCHRRCSLKMMDAHELITTPFRVLYGSSIPCTLLYHFGLLFSHMS
jgi:hypothetical protein